MEHVATGSGSGRGAKKAAGKKVGAKRAGVAVRGTQLTAGDRVIDAQGRPGVVRTPRNDDPYIALREGGRVRIGDRSTYRRINSGPPGAGKKVAAKKTAVKKVSNRVAAKKAAAKKAARNRRQAPVQFD